MIFLAGVLLSLDPRLLAVREVDLQPEDRQPRHLGPILPGAGGSRPVWGEPTVVHHPPSSIDRSPLVLLTVVCKHNHCGWLVFLLLALLQVATQDVT